MKSRFKRVLSLLLAFAIIFSLIPSQEKKIVKAEDGHSKDIRKWVQEHTPIYAGYYRVWNDVANVKNENAKTKMSDIPAEVDMVLAFYDNELEKIPVDTYHEYVEKLHNQGTKVIGSIFIHKLFEDIVVSEEKVESLVKEGYKIDKNKEGKSVVKFVDSEEGYKQRARYILDTYVYQYNFDGLDVDMETNDLDEGKDALRKADAVFKELGKEIGPKGNKNKLFIYDTTKVADKPIFKNNHDLIDLVLLQVYGKTSEHGVKGNNGENLYSVDYYSDTFMKYIQPKQLLVGFSFYEECSPKDNRWYDVPTKTGAYITRRDETGKVSIEHKLEAGIEESRAGRYANWQPKEGLKGGLFSYAIDRDGVAHPMESDANIFSSGLKATYSESDYLMGSTYSDSVKLKKMMASSDDYRIIDSKDFPDPALLNEVKTKVSKFYGDLKKYKGDLVLDNSDIKDLSGLSALENIKSLELKGLSKLTSLSNKDLPKSLIIDSSSPYAKEDAIVKFSGLISLESLDLSSMKLEELNILDGANWTNLKSVNISNNNLDLSPATKNREAVDAFLQTIEKNGGSLSHMDFSNQRPKGYFPSTFSPSNVRLDNESVKDYDLKNEILKGAVTASGYYVEKADNFADLKNYKIEGKTFVDESYTYEDFIKGVDYKDFKLEIRDSLTNKISLESFKENFANNSDESYKVEYFNDEGQSVHVLNVVKGEGKENLELVSKNVKPYGYDEEENSLIERAFDGEVKSNINEHAFFQFNAPGSFMFELNDMPKVNLWKLYQASSYRDNKENDIESASLEYIADMNFKLDDNLSINEKYNKLREQKWTRADGFEAGTDPIYVKELANIKARYWRFNFETVTGGKKEYAFPYVPEIQFYGSDVNSAKLVDLLEKAKKLDKEEYTTSSFARLENFMERASYLLSESNASQSQIDNLVFEIESAIENLERINLDEKYDTLALNNELKAQLDIAKKIDTSKVEKDILEELNELIAKGEMLLGEDMASKKDLSNLIEDLKGVIEKAKIVKENKVKLYTKFNVYLRPEKNSSDYLKILKTNTLVEGVVDGSWLRMEKDGVISYVALWALSANETLVEGYIISNTAYLNEINGKKIGNLKLGDKVRGKVVSENNEWLEIEVAGEKAYIEYKYLGEKYKIQCDLYYREKPRDKGKLLGTVKEDTIVYGRKFNEYWMEYRLPEKHGNKAVFSAAKFFEEVK